jgi:hypothetical protein
MVGERLKRRKKGEKEMGNPKSGSSHGSGSIGVVGCICERGSEGKGLLVLGMVFSLFS